MLFFRKVFARRDILQTLGFLGPRGTHSEAAALFLCGRIGGAELRPYPDIFSVMQAAADGETDSCIVPVENSLEGAVNVTMDTLAQSDDLAIERELIWDIHNQLMAKAPTGEVRVIYSHPQPLAQCRQYLKEHFPQARLVATESTAKAAELVAGGERGAAAICTARAGELYGLSAVATEIQDSMTNSTRFYQLRRRPVPSLGEQESGRALIICQIDGARAGSLCAVLEEFAARGVNMTRIISRPARTGLGVYIFFFDLEIEAGKSREPLEASIAAVRKKSFWLKDLGRFPVLEK
ncbi:MAG: prephenate dehydratase [Schwartzia sp.]|nr:prephenate dehydratase [Schwartzia sp. (in: firmicutes)]